MEVVEVEICGAHVVVKAGEDVGGELRLDAAVEPEARRHDVEALQVHDAPKVRAAAERRVGPNDLLHARDTDRKHDRVHRPLLHVPRLRVPAAAGRARRVTCTVAQLPAKMCFGWMD